MRVIGLMSGTSYDAIDAAAADIRIDGDTLVLTPLGMVSEPYSGELRAAVAAAVPPASTTVGQICQLDTEIGQAFAAVAARANAELCGGSAELISSHGQTMFHWVEGAQVKGTLQLGQPAWIAEKTGCTVVSDLRSRDVATGGQGAPLVSAFDVLWLNGRTSGSVALNLGGIANVTAPGGAPTSTAEGAAVPIAFDTGPANALIDAAVGEFTAGEQWFDLGGALGAAGTPNVDLLAQLLSEPYYAQPAPKSTGKELFHRDYLLAALRGYESLSLADIVATLTALTARTVADSVKALAATEVVVSGGGTKNPTLMAMLRDELGDIALVSSDELGVTSDIKEALAFAVLGYLTAHGLPGSIASCTGARHASVLGSLTPGSRGLPRITSVPSAPKTMRIEAL